MEYSQTFLMKRSRDSQFGLNPYSNGILTDLQVMGMGNDARVLILILMEYSQTKYTTPYGILYMMS